MYVTRLLLGIVGGGPAWRDIRLIKLTRRNFADSLADDSNLVALAVINNRS